MQIPLLTLTKKQAIPFCHLGVSQWVGALPPLARDFALPARPGDATDETRAELEEEEEEEEEHPIDFRGAFAPTAREEVLLEFNKGGESHGIR